MVADLWCPNHKLLIIAVELSILHYLSLVRISLKLFLRRALRMSDNTGVSRVFQAGMGRFGMLWTPDRQQKFMLFTITSK